MPRTKGSKNRPKINITKDYASQIAEKQESIVSLTAEIASIAANIDTLKADLKEKKTALKKAEKEVATLEAKKTKADAKAAEEAKKTEAESVVKKLLASVGAERQRRYRAMKRWRADPTEENFWGVVVVYAGVKFKTYSGLSFSYEVRKGRNGEYTKELWIDRRVKSKSLAWSSIILALGNIKGEVVERPKALGDIRGVTYIYGMFYRFGLIDVPDEVKEKMKNQTSVLIL